MLNKRYYTIVDRSFDTPVNKLDSGNKPGTFTFSTDRALLEDILEQSYDGQAFKVMEIVFKPLKPRLIVPISPL